MDFEALVKHISTIQSTLQAQAAHAVNLALTARNWLMGCYIVEFEQNGEDRAAYGEQLLKKLEQRLNVKGLNERRFREFRRLYRLSATERAYRTIHIGRKRNSAHTVRRICRPNSAVANRRIFSIHSIGSKQMDYPTRKVI